MHKLVKTTCDLIRFPTVTGHEKEIKKCYTYIENFFKDTNLKKRTFKKNGVVSVLYTFKKKTPKVMLHGHIDVVPAQHKNMYVPKIKQGKLFGRGSVDMKGAVAVLMHVMKDLQAEKPDVGLLLTADEETGGFSGTEYVFKQGIIPEFLLSAEPTMLKIGNRAKGVLWLSLSTKGKGAHAARPWNGESAILKMMKVIKQLQRMFPKKQNYYTTINFGTIRGGEATNKVADHCTLDVDIRYTPLKDPKKIINQIRKLVDDLKVLEIGSPAYCAKSNKYIGLLSVALKKENVAKRFLDKHAASDARYATKFGSSGLVFGPVGEGAHAAHEFVSIPSLKKTYNVLKEFCLQL